MKYAALAILLTTAAVAQDRDPKLDALASDLHAIARVAALSQDLGDTRQVQLAMIDANIDSLRIKRDDGTYRWASLQREEASRVTDEKSIEYVHTEKELRNITISAANAYRAEVVVPRKRGAFSENNRVWVRNILVDSTGFDGKVTHHEIAANTWVNPGDAYGAALPEIGKSVKATFELGVESGTKKAVATVALVQAKLVDDPNSPYFPAVTRLVHVRELAAARDINRGLLKSTVDEALLALPGELEKRAAELKAKPSEPEFDIRAALTEISRLMNGTLEQQAEARAQLAALIERLK
jgi:hypothetical protein